MKRLFSFVGVIFLTACGGGNNIETSATPNEAAAEAKVDANSPTPELDVMIRSAEMSLKQKNELEAAATLQTLREAPNLSVDQKMSVQDMIAQAQARLAQRAAQGDPQAQAAMKMLQMNPR